MITFDGRCKLAAFVASLPGGDRVSLPWPQPDGLSAVLANARGFDRPPWMGSEPQRTGPMTLAHPLSGARKTIVVPPEADPGQGLLLAMRELLADAEGSPQVAFLRLWRTLPERHDAAWWTHLPADPRVPSHTAWEAADVASAVTGAWPEPAILLFTIASAHDFISTARRTQDAWMGSLLLSYLTWQAARTVAEACGPDAVLSPPLRGQPFADLWLWEQGVMSSPPPPDRLAVGNLPNLFTAIVPAGSARKLAEAAIAAVETAWKEIAGGVRAEVEAKLGGDPGWGAAWDRQIPGFPRRLGIFWAASPWGAARPEEVVTRSFAHRPPPNPGEPADAFQELVKRVRRELGDEAAVTGLTYPLLSAFAGQALSARKNVRDFEQVAEPGDKCSLCGLRSALHPEEKGSYPELKAFWERLAQIGRDEEDGLKLKGRIRRGERLCAVCLTKRLALDAVLQRKPGLRVSPNNTEGAAKHYLGLDRHIFPSTASVATAPFLRAVLCVPELHPFLRAYATTVHSFLKKHKILYPANLPRAVVELAEKALGQKDAKTLVAIDGAWLFPSAYDTASIERETDAVVSPQDDALAAARAAAGELCRAAAERGVPMPSPYLAVLALDGDSMGEWLTGKRAPAWRELFAEPQGAASWVGDQKRPMGAAMHLALSNCLKNFSLELARPGIEDHGGSLLFAGGDDVLALLPATGILAALDALRGRFGGGPDGYYPGPDDGQTLRVLGGPGGMTASIGVAVVHHSHVLSHAIDWAYQLLEDEAKGRLGRNAFCVGVARRSGEATVAGFPFASKGGRSALEPLATILRLMEQGELSTRLAYRVAGCSWAAGSAALPNPLGTGPGAFETELLRLVRQHASEKARAEAVGAVGALYEAVADGPGAHRGEWAGRDVWETLRGLLLTAAFASGRGE